MRKKYVQSCLYLTGGFLKYITPIIPHTPADIPKPYKHPQYQECWQSPVYFRISFQMKNNQVQNDLLYNTKKQP